MLLCGKECQFKPLSLFVEQNGNTGSICKIRALCRGESFSTIAVDDHVDKLRRNG